MTLNNLKNIRDDATAPISLKVASDSIDEKGSENDVPSRPILSTIDVERKLKEYTSKHNVIKRNSSYNWEEDTDKGTRRLLVGVIVVCVMMSAAGIGYMLTRSSEKNDISIPANSSISKDTPTSTANDANNHIIPNELTGN